MYTPLQGVPPDPGRHTDRLISCYILGDPGALNQLGQEKRRNERFQCRAFSWTVVSKLSLKELRQSLPITFHPMQGNPDSGIRENFDYGIRNLGFWIPEYSLRNPESH